MQLIKKPKVINHLRDNNLYMIKIENILLYNLLKLLFYETWIRLVISYVLILKNWKKH